jgi:hypothetical protein
MGGIMGGFLFSCGVGLISVAAFIAFGEHPNSDNYRQFLFVYTTLFAGHGTQIICGVMMTCFGVLILAVHDLREPFRRRNAGG